METELHLFFSCNVHCAARTALHNKVHDILNETGFAERFERLGHTDLLRLYLHGTIYDFFGIYSGCILKARRDTWIPFE